MKNARRILAVLLLLAFGLGSPSYAVQAIDMSQPAVEAVMDASMPGNCDECGGDMAMTASSCFATCVGMQNAVAHESDFEVSDPGFVAFAEQRFRSSQSAPDPFPPRLIILS